MIVKFIYEESFGDLPGSFQIFEEALPWSFEVLGGGSLVNGAYMIIECTEDDWKAWAASREVFIREANTDNYVKYVEGVIR